MNIKWLIGAISVGLFISCENVKEAQTVSNSYPSVFPDYTFTAIPYNIAPLNFEVKGAQEIRADFAGEGVNLLTVTGKHEIRIPKKKWKEMLDKLKIWKSQCPYGIRLLLKGYDINLSRFGLHRMLLTNGLLIG